MQYIFVFLFIVLIVLILFGIGSVKNIENIERNPQIIKVPGRFAIAPQTLR
jgi:hypothetical protein